MKLLFAAGLLAVAAWFIARAVGLPIWTDWQIGDATDVAACVLVAVVVLGQRS